MEVGRNGCALWVGRVVQGRGAFFEIMRRGYWVP